LAYFKIVVLLLYPLVTFAQGEPQTITAIITQQILQHPILSGPSESQFYVDITPTKRQQQVIVIHPKTMNIPRQNNIPIRLTGHLKTIDLGGKSGTKNAYRGQVMYLSNWHYQQPAQYQPCWYQAKATKRKPEPEFAEHNNCAYYSSNEKLTFNPNHLTRIEFGQNQLATLNFKGQFFYLNKNGQSISAINYDNWADEFNNGLARTQRNGKIGFFNQQLQMIIPPQWDWAFPFENGQAIVCKDCTLKAMGEHKAVIGGLWGKIDISGQLIQPLSAKKF